MGNSFFIILNQINLSNSLTTKIYIKSPIFISWPYRYTLSLKCTTYSKLSILIMYYTSILHLPDLIQRTIFNLRQAFRELTLTYLVALSWYFHIKRLVWTFRVIAHSPPIKQPLALTYGFIYTAHNHFSIHSAMKSLVLAQCLGMIRTTMNYLYSQANKPDRKRTIFVPLVPLPWTAIIHENGIRHAISTKNVCQVLLNSLFTFIFTSSDAKRIARMIVNNRQGVTASVSYREMPLKVHLPKIIRPLGLKSLPCLMLLRFFLRYPPFASQDHCDGTRRRDLPLTHMFESTLELTSSPSGMFIPKVQNQLLHIGICGVRRVSRTPRTIIESMQTFFHITVQEFISCFSAYPKTTTKLRKTYAFLQSQCNKFNSLRHNGNFLPSHGCLLFKKAAINIQNVLPMSPNVCNLCVQPIHLGGMGPVNQLSTDSGKLFASFYALYAGVAFLALAAVLVAPFAHRLLHSLHLEKTDRDN